MAELDYDELTNMVKKVATSVSRNFPSYVTTADTEGHLWVWVLEKKTQISRAVDDGLDWKPKIYSTMRKVASDYCAGEMATVEGFDVTDLYRYSIPKIESLLPDVFNYLDWQSFALTGDGQPRGKGQVNETGDRTAELADIKAAFEELAVDTKELLFLHYGYQWTFEDLGEHFGITWEAAKKRSQRAVKALHRALGRMDQAEAPEPVGRRTVRTNASARAELANQYEG